MSRAAPLADDLSIRIGRAQKAPEVVIKVRDLVVGFGDNLVMDGLNLDVFRGEVLGFVGGSGMGKSVLMRTILGLVPKRHGTIEVFGADFIRSPGTRGGASSAASASCFSTAPCFRASP